MCTGFLTKAEPECDPELQTSTRHCWWESTLSCLQLSPDLKKGERPLTCSPKFLLPPDYHEWEFILHYGAMGFYSHLYHIAQNPYTHIFFFLGNIAQLCMVVVSNYHHCDQVSAHVTLSQMVFDLGILPQKLLGGVCIPACFLLIVVYMSFSEMFGLFVLK